MPPEPEVLGDGTTSGKEALGVTRGFEALHVSFALTSGLVGVLGAVIEIPVLAMFHARQNLLLGGAVALEFIGDDHARDVAQALEQLVEELLGRPLIPAALH